MPDDIEMSAEQETEEEMSIEEQEALFDQDESEYDDEDTGDTSTDEDAEDEEAADDSDDEEEDEESADDSDDTEEDSDEEDSDDDAEEEESDDDEDPLADIKKKAAELKQSEQDATDKATADAERSEKMSIAKDELLKELFGQEKVKVGDKEIDLSQMKEDYGEDIDTLITARAFQIVEPLMAKAMESSGYASSEELQALKSENEDFRFMSKVAQEHPDAWKIRDDDKFWNWVDAQGDDVKTLMEKGGVDGTSSVIGAYKKASIKKTNSVIDKKATAKKKQHTDLHSSTVRTKKGGKGKTAKKGGMLSPEEEAAEFDSYEVED